LPRQKANPRDLFGGQGFGRAEKASIFAALAAEVR
jgi:hypothetical protein